MSGPTRFSVAQGQAQSCAAVQAAIVGRERELSADGSAIEAALAGSGGVIFLTDESGIGKTRQVDPH